MDHPRRVIQTVSQSIPQRTAAPGFETRFESALARGGLSTVSTGLPHGLIPGPT